MMDGKQLSSLYNISIVSQSIQGLPACMQWNNTGKMLPVMIILDHIYIYIYTPYMQ
jgi:hypothetical protein